VVENKQQACFCVSVIVLRGRSRTVPGGWAPSTEPDGAAEEAAAAVAAMVGGGGQRPQRGREQGMAAATFKERSVHRLGRTRSTRRPGDRPAGKVDSTRQRPSERRRRARQMDCVGWSLLTQKLGKGITPHAAGGPREADDVDGRIIRTCETSGETAGRHSQNCETHGTNHRSIRLSRDSFRVRPDICVTTLVWKYCVL